MPTYHRMITRFLLLFGLLITFSFSGVAQKRYPVLIEPEITVPSIFLEDYNNPQNMRVRISLLDFDQKEYKIRIGVRFNDAGKQDYIGAARASVTILGGQAVYLDYAQLSALFNTTNLPIPNGTLSEGVCTFSFTAYSDIAGIPEDQQFEVSNAASGKIMFSVIKDQPPMLNLPAEKASVESINSMTNIMFSWMPSSFMNLPDQPVMYRLRIAEIPEGLTSTDVMASFDQRSLGQYMYSDLFQPSFMFQATDMKPGATYAWQVEAYQKIGADENTGRFANAGRSLIRTFTVKEDCNKVLPRPAQIIPDPINGGQMVHLAWSSSPNHLGYELKYRRAATMDQWSIYRLEPVFDQFDLDKTLIQEGIEYEYSVAPKCNGWAPAEYGGTFKMQTGSCPAPGTIIIDKNNSDEVQLSWEAASEAVSYSIDYIIGGITTTKDNVLSSAGKAQVSLPAITGSPYTVQLTAVCAAGSAMGPVQEILAGETGFVGPCPLPEPFSLQVEHEGQHDSQSAKALWTASDLHESFVFRYRAQADAQAPLQSLSVSAPVAVLNGIQYGVPYLYEVEFVCKGGKKALSKQGIFVVEDNLATAPVVKQGTANCFPPATMTGEAKSRTVAEFSWPRTSEVDAYQLFYRKVGDPDYLTFSTTGTTVRLKDLDEGAIYEYKLRIRCGGEYSIFNAGGTVDLSIVHSNAECDTIPYTRVGKKSPTAIQLTWKYETQADNLTPSRSGYIIQYIQSSQSWDLKNTVDLGDFNALRANNIVNGQVQYTIDNLSPSTEYKFKVLGKCNDNPPYNSIITASTTESDDAADCSSGGVCDRTSKEPISPTLVVGQMIQMADLNMEIATVAPSMKGNGYYTGTGILRSNSPLMGMSDQITLGGSFTDIFVNDKGCVREGEMDIQMNANLLPPELKDKALEYQKKIDETVNKINAGLAQADKALATAEDATEEALIYFQGGDQIGMPKANGGGLSEPYTSAQELTGQKTSPSATGVTIGGQNIPTSALPVLIKDKSGDVFSVDAQGNVTEVGAYGGPAGMQKQTPNTALGITVSFAPMTGMKYGFDPFQPRYAEKPAMEPHYLKLGDQYYSAKAITPGDVDVISFSVSPRGTKLRFVNRDGFEYKQNGGVLTLAGGPAEDAQEIMAVYTKGGKDYVVGALLLASYPVKHQNVVIVLTDAAQTITEAQRAQLEASLNASFGQAAMRYTVSVDASSVAGQGWCGSPRCSAFRPDGSALLSNDYQGDEAAMIEYFTTRAGFTADPSTAYLFAVSTSLAGTTEGGLQGKMNFDKQFGFLYNVQKESDFTAIGRTLAHEVGHGSFKLYHIFENMYLGPDAKEDNNLMSYSSLASSNQLNKLQWDIVHKPGVTWGVFARDVDQQAVFDLTIEREVRKINLQNNTILELSLNEFYSKTNTKSALVNMFNNELGVLTSYPLNYFKVEFSPSSELVIYSTDDSDSRVKKTDSKIAVKISTREYSKNSSTSDGKSYTKYTFNNIEPIGTVLEMSVLESEAIIFESYIFPSAIALLNEYRSLTPQEIAFVRTQIELVEDNTEKGDLYLRLQAKVPYHNQRNNITTLTKNGTTEQVLIGDIMCNITSMSMGLEMLGLTNPCNPQPDQFEDCIEQNINFTYDKTISSISALNDGTIYDCAREHPDGRESAVNSLYDNIYMHKNNTNYLVPRDTVEIQAYMLNLLRSGYGVVVSFAGHLIRIQSSSSNGYIYDDPYGQYDIKSESNFRTWIQKNASNSESGVGEDNERLWRDFNVLPSNQSFIIEYYAPY